MTLFVLSMSMLNDVKNHHMQYVGQYWFDLPIVEQNAYIEATKEANNICVNHDVYYYKQDIYEYYTKNPNFFRKTPMEIIKSECYK